MTRPDPAIIDQPIEGLVHVDHPGGWRWVMEGLIIGVIVALAVFA